MDCNEAIARIRKRTDENNLKRKEESKNSTWDWEPEFSDEDVHALSKIHMECMNEERDTKLLWNTITKQKQTYKSFRKQYGKKYADVYLKYEEEKVRVPENFSKQFWKDNTIKKVASPISISKAKKENTDNKINGHFVPILFSVIDNPVLYKKINKYLGVYIFLYRKLVRGKLRDDKYNIFEKYHEEGKLAYCTSYRKLGKKINSVNTAIDHVKRLVEIGAIKMEDVNISIKDNNGETLPSTESVFVLGEVEDGKEAYFINDLL